MDTAEQLGIDLAEIPDRSELKQIVSPGESIILVSSVFLIVQISGLFNYDRAIGYLLPHYGRRFCCCCCCC